MNGYPIIKNQTGETLAVLDKVMRPEIKRKINADYTLSFDTVLDGDKSSLITHNNRIEWEGETYDIVKYTSRHRSDGLYLSVYCEHESYRLIDETLSDGFSASGQTPTQMLTSALAGTDFSVGTVEVADTGDVVIEGATTVRAVLAQIVETFGGEYEYSGNTVSLLSSIGDNNGADFRVGKNIRGVEKVVDNSVKDSEGNPRITYSVDVVEVAGLDEFSGLEGVTLGDTVHVYDEALDIDVYARVYELYRNPLRPEGSKIVLDNFVGEIAEYTRNARKAADTVEANREVWDRANAISTDGTISASILEGEIDAANATLSAGLGSVTITDNNGILITDQPTEAASTKAVRLLGGVLAIANSKDGSGNWEWRTFGTGDGFVADEITSGSIATSLISIIGNDSVPNAFKWDAGGLRIHKITSGSLDSDNYIHMDNNGFKFYKDGSLVINIGFDGSDNVATTDTVVMQDTAYNQVKITPADGVVATHGDGSQTILDGDGFKRKIVSNGHIYNYIALDHADNGVTSGDKTISKGSGDPMPTIPSETELDADDVGISWVTIPNADFAGRHFVAVPSLAGFEKIKTSVSANSWTFLSYMSSSVKVLEYAYESSLGDYSASTTYSAENIVKYGDLYYECLVGTTGNPPTNATYWELLEPKFKLRARVHSQYNETYYYVAEWNWKPAHYTYYAYATLGE